MISFANLAVTANLCAALLLSCCSTPTAAVEQFLARQRRHYSKPTVAFGGLFTEFTSDACETASSPYSGYSNYYNTDYQCPFFVFQAEGGSVSDILARASTADGFCYQTMIDCGTTPDNNYGGRVRFDVAPGTCPTPPVAPLDYVRVVFPILGVTHDASDNPVGTQPMFLTFCYRVIEPASEIGGYFGQSETAPIPASITSVPVNPETGNRTCPPAYIAVPAADVVSQASDCGGSRCEYTIYYCKYVSLPLVPGPKGATGYPGPNGFTGPDGYQPGPAGYAGPVGPPGAVGLITGARGPAGLAGVKGSAGPNGDKGDTGRPGYQGRDGRHGTRGNVDIALVRDIVFNLMPHFLNH